MKRVLTFACWLLAYATLAQERLTDFENPVLKLPNSAQLIDTLKGRMLFTINQNEISSPSLWVSDGTAENTRQLKDIFGVSPYVFPYRVKKYGYVYLKGEALWRTNGNTLERLAPNTGMPEKMYELNNQLLLCVERLDRIDYHNLTITSFAWLDSLNRTKVWENDVVSYQLIDSVLHYIKYNRQSKFYELCKLGKDGKINKAVLEQNIAGVIQRFEYLAGKGREYYFLETTDSRKLIQKAINSNENMSLTDWGGSTFFPAYIKNTEGKVYFLRHFGVLSVHELSEDGQINEKWVIDAETVQTIQDKFNPYFIIYGNWKIIDEKLLFSIFYSTQGRLFCKAIDLNKGTITSSRNLYEYFYDYIYNDLYKTPAPDTYVLDNQQNRKITYSFMKDSVLQVTNYSAGSNNMRDTVFRFNNKTIRLLGNVYTLDDATQRPLLPEKQFFDGNTGRTFFMQTQLAEKLIFVRFNMMRNKYELWASDGTRQTTVLLFTLDGNFDRFIEVAGYETEYYKGKLYVLTKNYYSNNVMVYETDGTQAGSRIIYTYPDARLDFVQHNRRQLVFRAVADNNMYKVLIAEEGKEWYLTDIPSTSKGNEVLVTSTDTYVLVRSEVFQYTALVDSHELLRVEKNRLVGVAKNVFQVLGYQNKLYYSCWLNQQSDNTFSLHYTDNTVQAADINTEGIYTFNIYGNKLVYQQINAGKLLDCTILDLEGHWPRQKINQIAPKYINLLNDVLIINTADKLYLLKDGKQQEYTADFEINIIGAFTNGLLLIGSHNLMFYDLIKYQAVPIVRGQEFGFQQFSNNETYVLIQLYTNGGFSGWYYWTLANKKLEAVSGVAGVIEKNASGVFFWSTYDQNLHVWSFDGNKLTEKYHLPLQQFNSLNRLANEYYIAYEIDGRGKELVKTGTDSLITYPELAAGQEGIILGKVFMFNGKLYVFAFTRIDGWQIWKMDTIPQIVLGNEYTDKTAMPVYPNPTQDWLYVTAEKALPYRLLNTQGQLLMQGVVGTGQGIDIRQLPQALYLIQLFDGARVYVQKIVKQ